MLISSSMIAQLRDNSWSELLTSVVRSEPHASDYHAASHVSS